MYKKVATDMNFPAREKEITALWKSNDVIRRSFGHRKDGETFTFEQMATVQAFYWNYGYLAGIQVDLPGGLDESVEHEITLQYELRTYYLPFNSGGKATLKLKAIQD